MRLKCVLMSCTASALAQLPVDPLGWLGVQTPYSISLWLCHAACVPLVEVH